MEVVLAAHGDGLLATDLRQLGIPEGLLAAGELAFWSLKARGYRGMMLRYAIRCLHQPSGR